MIKSIEALARGYISFRVRIHDGEEETRWSFWFYGPAKRFKDLHILDEVVPDRGELITLEGYHIFKGWRAFYVRVR